MSDAMLQIVASRLEELHKHWWNPDHPLVCAINRNTEATLMLAEEVKKLASNQSALAQATTALGNKLSKLNDDFAKAWPVIQAALLNQGTPAADVQAAIAAMNSAGTTLDTLDTDFQGALGGNTGGGTGGSTAATVAITVDNASITSGATATLTVTATNATNVVVTGDDGSTNTLAPTGGTLPVSPTKTTVYTATATGSDGTTVTATQTITVQ